MSSSSPAHGRAVCRLTELEARYDGPIPDEEKRALRYGASLTAEGADARVELAFFRSMIESNRRCGKAWRERGDSAMAARSLADARIYLAGWRSRRRRLVAIAGEHRAYARLPYLEQRRSRTEDAR